MDKTLTMTTASELKQVLTSAGQAGGGSRVGWVDYAKGFCIIFVVMMHSTLGVEKAAGAEGWMHYLVEFARPFRMPDFFLIAGLFLALVIARPWKDYLDRKVLHFVYFYLIWTFIQFGTKIPVYGAEHGYGALPYLYLQTLWEPFATLWFIYMLPIMFVVTKSVRGLPWPLVFAFAAALQIAPIETGNLIIDEFCSRYVYFFAGYIFAPQLFRLATWAQTHSARALAILAVWIGVNGLLIFNGTTLTVDGVATFVKYGDLPIISLMLGFAGAVGVILVSSQLAKLGFMTFLRYCGQHSIVIYLAFFFPMAVTRTILLKLGLITDIGTISVIVTAAAVIAPLILFWIVEKTGYGRFLFERPQWARFTGSKRGGKGALEPAE